MKNKYIIISSIIACSSLYVVEQLLHVDYFTKTLSKLIFFILIPLFFIYFIEKKAFREALNIKLITKKNLTLGLFLGFSSFFIVLVGYFIFKNQLDLENIKNELIKTNINIYNFIFIGLYITFINSFLEEFFFRGFIFLNLYDNFNKKFAYIFSSILFALYHIAIFKTWFNIYLIILALISLITIGFVFDFIDTKSKNFINSWIVHILADAAIIIVGFIIFGII